MSGRRAFTPDPSWVILKRLRFVRTRLRPVLYSCLGKDAPCFGDKHKNWSDYYCREISWGMKVREFVSDRSFRYIELMVLAEEYRKKANVVPPTNLAEDLALLQGWEQYVGQVRREQRRFGAYDEGVLDVNALLQRLAFDDQKTALLNGLCHVCGGDAPCSDCGTPAVALDGRGGLVAVESPKT